VIRNGKYYCQINNPGQWSDGCWARLDDVYDTWWQYYHNQEPKKKLRFITTITRGKYKDYRWVGWKSQLRLPKDQMKSFLVLEKLKQNQKEVIYYYDSSGITYHVRY